MRPERHIIIKCPECGRLENSVLTVFSFSGRRPARIDCSCGANKAVINSRDGKLHTIQFMCPICDASHVVSMPSSRFWHDPMVTIDCPETEVEIAHLGEPEKITHALEMQRSLGELIPDQTDVDELFSCPEVMYQVLSRLHVIARSGNLYCECGNDNIEVDLFPDKLELRCPTCDSLSIIYAENDDDLAVMSRIEVIEMKRAGFTSVDASRFNPKHMRR